MGDKYTALNAAGQREHSSSGFLPRQAAPPSACPGLLLEVVQSWGVQGPCSLRGRIVPLMRTIGRVPLTMVLTALCKPFSRAQGFFLALLAAAHCYSESFLKL